MKTEGLNRITCPPTTASILQESYETKFTRYFKLVTPIGIRGKNNGFQFEHSRGNLTHAPHWPR